jgi:hypothetical protein
MEDIVLNDIYDYAIFYASGKYHMAIWTNNHVIIASHICGLGLQRSHLCSHIFHVLVS